MKNGKYSCADCENQNCFLRNLSLEWLTKIDAKKINLYFQKSQYVFMENHPVIGIYFIKKGKVKVFSTGINEKEQIVRLASEGHILGHRGYGAEVYPISTVTMTESLICFVDNATIYDAFMQNPQLTYSLMMFYSRELRKTEIRMKYLGQMTVREKVAEAILYLKEVFGIDPQDNTLNVDISRQEIANLSGTNADQVIRQCKDFEQEKLIIRKKRKISLIDPQRLEMIVSQFRIHEFFNQQ